MSKVKAPGAILSFWRYINKLPYSLHLAHGALIFKHALKMVGKSAL